jgi:hypothetical protein
LPDVKLKFSRFLIRQKELEKQLKTKIEAKKCYNNRLKNLLGKEVEDIENELNRYFTFSFQ